MWRVVEKDMQHQLTHTHSCICRCAYTWTHTHIHNTHTHAQRLCVNRPAIKVVDFSLERYIGEGMFLLIYKLITTPELHYTHLKNVCVCVCVRHHFWLITLIVLLCVVCYLHSYMSIVESLPTYGVHYYAVKVSELIGSSYPRCPGKANRKFSGLLVWRFGGEWELMEVGLVKRLLARGNWATEFYP